MSGQSDFDRNEASHSTYTAPYTSHHPVPTVQRYREHRQELDAAQKKRDQADDEEPEEDGKLYQDADATGKIFKGEDQKAGSSSPYNAENRNEQPPNYGPKEPKLSPGQAPDTDGD